MFFLGWWWFRSRKTLCFSFHVVLVPGLKHGMIFSCQKLDPAETTYQPVSLNSMQCEVTVKWGVGPLVPKKMGKRLRVVQPQKKHPRDLHSNSSLFIFFFLNNPSISHFLCSQLPSEGCVWILWIQEKDIVDRKHARHQYQVLLINKKNQKTLYQRYSKKVNCFFSKVWYIIILNPTFLGDVWIFHWLVSISSFTYFVGRMEMM